MFKYLPASFVYTSHVSDQEQSQLDKTYMPFVLESATPVRTSAHSRVRTDYHDLSAEPWGLFTEVMFRHFRQFVADHLLNAGDHVVHMKTWFNYYPSAGAMNYHSHPEADFGLVYCLRNAGKKKTLFNTFSHDYDTMKCRFPLIEACRFSWEPVPGEFVLFPASLFHAAQVTELEGERITLVANVYVKENGKATDLSLRLEHPGGR